MTAESNVIAFKRPEPEPKGRKARPWSKRQRREIIAAIIVEHAGHVADCAGRLAHSADRIKTLCKELEELR